MPVPPGLQCSDSLFADGPQRKGVVMKTTGSRTHEKLGYDTHRDRLLEEQVSTAVAGESPPAAVDGGANLTETPEPGEDTTGSTTDAEAEGCSGIFAGALRESVIGWSEKPLPVAAKDIEHLHHRLCALRDRADGLKLEHDGTGSDFPVREVLGIAPYLSQRQREAVSSCEKSWMLLVAANRKLASDASDTDIDRHIMDAADNYGVDPAEWGGPVRTDDALQYLAVRVRDLLRLLVAYIETRITSEDQNRTAPAENGGPSTGTAPIQNPSDHSQHVADVHETSSATIVDEAVSSSGARPYLDLIVDMATKTITRKDFDATVCLFNAPEQWALFEMLLSAAGKPMPPATVSHLTSGDSSRAASQNRVQLNATLIPLGIKIDGHGAKNWVLGNSAETTDSEWYQIDSDTSEPSARGTLTRPQ